MPIFAFVSHAFWIGQIIYEAQVLILCSNKKKFHRNGFKITAHLSVSPKFKTLIMIVNQCNQKALSFFRTEHFSRFVQMTMKDV